MLKTQEALTQPTEPIEFAAQETQAGLLVTAAQPDLAISPAAVQCQLTEPLKTIVPWQGDPADVVRGLMGYGYGNNVFAANLRTKHRHTQTAVRQMVPDARRLASMLRAEASHDELVVPARVASFDAAAHHARDRLVTMKPSQLTQLCQQLQMPIDELEIWRRKHGDRYNRPIALYDIDDAGADSERLRRELVQRLFKEIHVLDESGVALRLVHQDDLPPQRWRGSGPLMGIQRHQLLPLSDALPRFEMAFTNDAVAERRVIPQLQWLVTYNEHNWPAYDRANYEGGHYSFDKEHRILSLHSPIMGALAVRASSRPSPGQLAPVLASFYSKYRGYGSAKQQRNSRLRGLPRAAIAGLAAAIADSYPTYEPTDQGFAEVAQRAYQDPAIAKLLAREPRRFQVPIFAGWTYQSHPARRSVSSDAVGQLEQDK